MKFLNVRNVRVERNAGAGPSLALVAALALSSTTALAFAQEQKSSSKQTAPAQSKKSAFKTVTIPVEGMTCVSCVSGIKKALKSVVGVTTVEVSLSERNAKVSFTEGLTSADAIAEKISKLGYKVGSWTESKK